MNIKKNKILKPKSDANNKNNSFTLSTVKGEIKHFSVPKINWTQQKQPELKPKKWDRKTWKQIDGFPNYIINRHGNIKSISREIKFSWSNRGTKILPEVLLTPHRRINLKKMEIYYRYGITDKSGQRKFVKIDDLLDKYFPNTKKYYSKICPVCNLNNKWIRGFDRIYECLNPRCEIPHILCKPDIEKKLFTMQYHYLQDRDEKKLSELYKLMKIYARSLVLKCLSGKFLMEKSLIEEKAHDVAVQLIDLYLRKPEFKINSSFGSYMSFKVKQELFYAKNEEDHESLHTIINTKGTDTEILEAIEAVGYDSLFEQSEDSPEEIFMNKNENNVISTILLHLESLHKKLDENYPEQKYFVFKTTLLLGVWHFISRNFKDKVEEKFCVKISKYYDVDSKELNKIIQKFMSLIYRLLKNMDD